MEPTAPFHLEKALDQYLGELNRQRCLRRDDLAELKSHLLDQMDDWRALGLSPEEAWRTALTQLGDASLLQGEFRKVNRWYSRGQKILTTSKRVVRSKRIAAFGVLFCVLTLGSMFTGRAADRRKVAPKSDVRADSTAIPFKRPSQALQP